MKRKLDLQSPQYTPSRMLNHLACLLNVETDGAIARELNASKATISRIRQRKILIGDGILLKAHMLTGRPASEFIKLAGMGGLVCVFGSGGCDEQRT